MTMASHLRSRFTMISCMGWWSGFTLQVSRSSRRCWHNRRMEATPRRRCLISQQRDLKYCSCFSAFIVPSFSCLRQELKMKSSVSLSHPFSSLILTSSCLTRLPLSGESRSRGPDPLCPAIVSWIFSPRVF